MSPAIKDAVGVDESDCDDDDDDDCVHDGVSECGCVYAQSWSTLEWSSPINAAVN